MLLHGDGTNGAQNNTFLDSSTNNFTITRNGNTTQGSFSPYGSNWSNNFNGTNAYLTLANNTNWVLGTSYTVEAWVNFSDVVDQDIICGSNTRWWLSRSLTDTGVTAGKFGFSANVGSWSSISSTTTPVVGVWYHVAATISSGTVSLYVNGVREATGSLSIPTDNIDLLDIATWNGGVSTYGINGYISNLRLVKGSVIYTGTSFTVPTAPLTAVTNTVLLTCQSNRFIDNSASPLTITANGTPSVQRFNPFGTSTAYSTSVIGGSGYFDSGGDDYLSLATATALGTGNVTVEFWFYPDDTSVTYRAIYDGRSVATTNTGFGIFQYGQTIEIYGNGLKVSTAANAFTAKTWTHFAVVRTSGTCQIYINGVASGSSGSYSDDLTSTIRTIARNVTAGNYFIGYISNLREVTSAVYSGTFTPPTAPVTAISGTSLLTNFTNAGIFDNAMMNNLETVGNAQISTSVVKYGTGSIALDGTGDWLYSPDTLTPAFTTGDFTVEFWINPTNWSATYAGVVCGILTNSLWIGKNASNFVLRAANNTDLVSYGTMPTTGVWTHIAVTRSGTTARMFYDGTQVASATTAHNFVASAFYVGQDGGSNALIGYIDDLRITKGYARYTATFTPPTAAFPNIGPV
jgi:hypothetical protein